MEQEALSTSLEGRVLVITAPNDPQGSELVKELSVLGFSALLAETVELAARADETVCIVVLRPGQWRTTPSLFTAIRCQPRYLIPVLSESMALPSAATWATEAFSLQEPLSETAQKLAPYLKDYLQAIAVARSASEDRHASSRELLTKISAPTAFTRRYRGRWRFPFSFTSLLVVVLVILGIGLAITSVSHVRRTSNNQLLAVPTYSAAHLSSYTAAVPGPGCVSGADWEVGRRYKAAATPRAGTASTPPATGTTVPAPTGTATLQAGEDYSTLASCQQDGLLLTQQRHFDVSAATVFFLEGQDIPLEQHFYTQITARLQSGTDQSSFFLGVRSQNNAPESSYDSGYGDDNLYIGINGSWATTRINNETNQIDKRFTRGYVKPGNTFTLAAEVDGPRVLFSVNGEPVTTIIDTTYPQSYGIDFGIGDPDAKKPTSALFSHFVYTPLKNTDQPTNALFATATTQALQNEQTPYTAPIPGFGCDPGKGQWTPISQYVSTHCSPRGLVLSQDASAQYVGTQSFYWRDGNFPQSYKVQARINASGLNNGCAGFITRVDQHSAGYAFFICSDGSWLIVLYKDDGSSSNLATGSVSSRPVYTLEATSNGTRQSLALDGVQIASVNDISLKITDHIELAISGHGATAVFSNFVFTPETSS